MGLGVLEARRASVLLAAARARDNHGDAPFPECFWWRTGTLFVHTADLNPILEDGVVLQVPVDRRFLEPSGAQREYALDIRAARRKSNSACETLQTAVD